MPIAADFEVQADGDIRHVANSNHYTVIEFHRWLGDLMDDAAAAGDDILDITDSTASERSTDNIITLKAPFNIDDTAAQYLYDGSIVQKGGDEIYDGIVVIAAAGMYLDVIQNGALATNFWTTGYNADSANGISHRFMLKVRANGYDIDGRRLVGTTREFGYTYSEFKINGTSRGNNVMALAYATDLNNQTVAGTVSGWTTITNTEGYRALDVNGDAANEFYFSEWDKDSYTINQFYERMKWLTRRGSGSTTYGLNGALFRGITHEVVIDTPTGTFSAVEPISWGLDLGTVAIAGTAGQFTCAASTIVVGQTLRISGTYGGTGSITGYSDPTSYLVSATNGTTTFTLVTTSGAAIVTTAGTPTGLRYDLRSGTGVMTAIDSVTAGTKLWMQIISGVAPINNQLITGNTSGANCLMNVTITERSLSFPWCGASTGSSIIGAYGFGVDPNQLTASDKLFDLSNTQRTPPNNVTFSVGGLVSGEDRVLVTNLGYDIAYTTEAGGPFTDNETLTFSGGGTARLNVLVDNGTTGRMNIRMLTGTAPIATETISGGSSSATAVVGGIEPGIDQEQLLNNGLLNGAAVTSVVCTATIPTDTPTTGTIRILRANGVMTSHAYSAYSGATFTIASHDFSSNNAAANAGIFISYIDKLATGATESFTGVYSADRNLFIRVRDGGGTPIKTFSTTGTLGSAGGSTTAIRTADT
jgi:hypothetical protein